MEFIFEHTLEIVGTLVGLLYLWLEYRANIYLWITGIVMPVIYLFVYYRAGLYADFGINVYYLVAALYGWVMWRYGTFVYAKLLHRKALKQRVELPITKLPVRYLLPATVLFFIAFITIAWVLIDFTDSNVPWWDAFTTAASIIGMWMLARKYVEQWWVWFVVDLASSGLYVYKELYFTAGLYAFYAIIAIFGYFKWKGMMQSLHL